MTDQEFRPTLFFKADCPFCLKVRVFLLEAGLLDQVNIRDFAPGTSEETSIRSQLEGKLSKVTFPAAELAVDSYLADSDGIIANLAARFGRDTENLPTLRAYVENALQPLMKLYRANMELKAKAE